MAIYEHWFTYVDGIGVTNIWPPDMICLLFIVALSGLVFYINRPRKNKQ